MTFTAQLGREESSESAQFQGLPEVIFSCLPSYLREIPWENESVTLRGNAIYY